MVRVSASPKGETVSALARSLGRDIPSAATHAPLARSIERAADELASAGLVERHGSRLVATRAGRERAAAYLDVAPRDLPTRWPTARDGMLIAKALGIVCDKKALERLRGADGLRAEIIRQDFALPLDPAPTLAQARKALSWRLLSRGASEDVVERVASSAFSGTAVLAALLYSELGAAGRPDAAKGLRLLASRALGTRPDAKSLRGALLSRLVADDGAVVAEPAAAPDTIEQFAARALAAGRASPTGRFGDSRVFISHAWRQYIADNPDDTIGLDEFKAKLVEANRLGHASLARADLVPAMDQADVDESRVDYMTATFHFIRI